MKLHEQWTELWLAVSVVMVGLGVAGCCFGLELSRDFHALDSELHQDCSQGMIDLVLRI